MRRPRRRPVTTNTSVPLDIQALPLGTQSADAFLEWDSPVTSVSNQNWFGETAKYLRVSDRSFAVAKTSGISRDQEVTFYAPVGGVYLRWNDGGDAIFFFFNTLTDAYGLYILSGVTDGLTTGSAVGIGMGTTGGILRNFTLPVSVPGYVEASRLSWTVGVEGFEIYLKYNGTEFFRTTSFHCLAPGRIALGVGEDTTTGFRNVTATHNINISGLYSDISAKFFDIRDFGMKTLSTTGSMTAGSATLTLASDPGFAIGDKICVATGGEAGGGVPGERGVGGQWPTLMYATVAAMNSDTTQVVNKVAGVLATGDTYRWTGSAWVAYDQNGARYLNKIVPRGLTATITNVSGTTLTLDTAATVATTGANVYFDNATLFSSTFDSETSGIRLQPGCTIYIPEGTWIFAGYILLLGGVTGLNVLGSGKTTTTILSPAGMAESGVNLASCPGARIANMSLTGNCRTDKGYMFRFNSTDLFTGTSGAVLAKMTGCNDGLIENIVGTNYSQGVSELSSCNNATQRYIDVVHQTGHKQYFQWAVQIAGSENCASEDVDFDSPYLIKGVESFGSNGSVIRRVTGRNVIFASNASSDLTIEDCDVVYEAGAAEDASWNTGLAPAAMYPSSGEPLVNLNTNIGGSSSGITIDNCNFEVQGTLWGSGGGVGVIGISGSVNNVTVSGQYPAKPVTEPSGKFTLPDLGADVVRAVRCDSSSLTLVVDGIRVNGAYTGTPVGSFSGSVQTNTTVRNCVLDNLGAGGTQTNNITNAEYEALP